MRHFFGCFEPQWGHDSEAKGIFLPQFAHVNSTSLTGQLIGRKVVWKHGKKGIIGQITGFHGKKGMVRVKFRRGVPGQALGTTVELAV